MLHPDNLSLSPDIVSASVRFRQGNVLENVEISFAFNKRMPITQAAREAAEGHDVARVSLPWAIITSQTCDLQNPRRMQVRPFLTVARVFDAATEFDKGNIGHIRKGNIGDLVLLTGACFGDGTWVADLRCEGLIERGVLIGKDPIAGFSDETGYIDFAQRLGAVRSRGAIDDLVRKTVLAPLHGKLSEGEINVDTLSEIRIRALPRLDAASSVELFLLIEDDVDPAAIESITNKWFEEITAGLPKELVLIDVTVKPVSQFTRSEEIGTERLNFDEFSEDTQ